MIGALLVIIAVILAVEMKSLLIGESASRAHPARHKGGGAWARASSRSSTLGTMQPLGPDELLVGAKIAVDPTATCQEVAEAIDGTERRVRHAVPIARAMYLNADLRRPDKDREPSPSTARAVEALQRGLSLTLSGYRCPQVAAAAVDQ